MFLAMLLVMLGQVNAPATPEDVERFQSSPYVMVEDRGAIDSKKTKAKVATLKKHITHVRTDQQFEFVICKWNGKPTAESVGAVKAAFDRVVPYRGKVTR